MGSEVRAEVKGRLLEITQRAFLPALIVVTLFRIITDAWPSNNHESTLSSGTAAAVRIGLLVE